MVQDSAQAYIFYGTRSSASEVKQFLRHCFEANLKLEALGRRRVPVCIWGHPGIGKTELVEALAQELGYALAYLAPAQFEEMGDLTGMPRIAGDRTELVPPDWVPRQPGPGILLLDDFNRADERILRGMMQLLQNHEMLSWKLPPGWQIVLTANPDGGQYAVTPLDEAMLTRMRHISLVFEAKTWAAWAEQAGILPLGIDFVLGYPEIVQGRRTNPRSLVQFFEALAFVPEPKEALGLVQSLADAHLDSETASAFMSFLQNHFGQILQPEALLNAQDFEAEVAKPLALQVQEGGSLRVDILATFCTRLLNQINQKVEQPSPLALRNVQQFILWPLLPNDLRLNLARQLVQGRNPHFKLLLAHPEIGKLLLNKL